MGFRFLRLLIIAAISVSASVFTSFGEGEKQGPDTVTVGKTVDAKFVDFAKRVESGINSKDPSVINSNFNFDIFFDRMMGGRKVSDKTKSEFIEGFSKSFAFGSKLAGTTKLKLLKMEKTGTETRALFRALDSASALVYLNFLLLEQNGKVCIGDFYTATLGEDMSAAIGRNAVPVIARSDSSFVGKLLQKETEFSKNTDKLSQINAALAKQDPDTVLRIYEELPDCLKNDKMFLLMRVKAGILKGGDSKEYKDALASMKGAVKEGDSSLDMILMDFYFLKKDYPKAHACIENLNKMTGNTDPYLDALNGNIFKAEGKFVDAETSIKKAIRREPALEQAYWNLVSVQFAQKKWADSIATLESIEKQFGQQMSFENMENGKDYAELVKTEEYRKWKESRLKSAPDTSKTQPPPPVQPPPSDTSKKTTNGTKKPRMLEPK